jgi:thioredoxin 1
MMFAQSTIPLYLTNSDNSMKNLFVFFFALSLATLGACQTPAQQQAIKVLSVENYEKQLQNTPNAQLVDVRTLAEYSQGHLTNASNIDVKQGTFKSLAAKLDKTKPVFVYCKSGVRSNTAAEILAELGFKEVYNMEGGILKWESAGKPIIK